MEFNYWIASQPGPLRKRNEDGAEAFEVNNTLFLLIADGFGVSDDQTDLLTAGKIAVEAMKNYIKKFYIYPGEASLKFIINQSFYHANAVIRYFSMINGKEYKNYGSSLTLAAITPDKKLYTAHAGITRLYLMRGTEIFQGTEDDNEATILLRQGKITQDEFVTHPGRNMVTKALGIGDDLIIDIKEAQLGSGDIIALLSDGVYRTLGSPRIQALIYEAGEISKACEWLIQGSEELKTPDNISAVISYIE